MAVAQFTAQTGGLQPPSASLPGMVVVPDSAQYSAQQGSSVVWTQLDGGSPRVRLNQVNPDAVVNLSWSGLDASTFSYMQAFFRTTIMYGSLPFTLNMIIDDSSLQPYLCRLVPGTWKTPGQTGYSYAISAQVSCQPLITTAQNDTSLVQSYTSYGSTEQVSNVYAALATLATVSFPANL